MQGIDISSNNGNVDFKQVKASGVEIVYIKATQGVNYINPLLLTQYNGAKSTGLKIGFYHYLTPDNSSLQAQYFLNAIDGLVADCKYVVDVEGTWTINEASKTTREFANYLISNNKEVCIYTGDYFYRDNLNSSVKNLPLWVANYGDTILANSYVGLQHSATGRMSGINGNVDLDKFDNGILLNKPIIEEVKKVNNIVVYGNCTDQGDAEKLADYLNCPTIHGDRPFDYSNYKNVICIGAPGKLLFTGYCTKLIQGNDRYATSQMVLDFIKAGGK